MSSLVIDLAGSAGESEVARDGSGFACPGHARSAERRPAAATALCATGRLDVPRMRGMRLPFLRGVRVAVRNPDGSAIRDPQTSHASYRLCRHAGLPEKGWHPLRHTF